MSTPVDDPAHATSWNCPSCGSPTSSAYCPACGERRWSERDLTFRHLFEQLLEGMIHFDSRLLRTALTLVAAPGRLTTAYLEGCHRQYVAPFNLFLVANVVSFLVQALSGWGVFAISLSEHLGGQTYRTLAQRWVTGHLAARGMTMDQYAPIFDHAGSLYAKSLVMVMLPFFAIAVGLLFVDRRKVAVAHLVFAVHYYAYLLVFLSVFFPVVAVVVWLWSRLGLPWNAGLLDWSAMSVEGIVCLVYLARAVTVVYGAGLIRRWLSAGLLTVATLYILWVYRFVLFVITLWST